jgi:hypothetical protein
VQPNYIVCCVDFVTELYHNHCDDVCSAQRDMRELLYDIILLIVVLIHLVAAPYTKVEESFNVQATHDIYTYGTNITAYDHLEFSGVVPRTFIGPLLMVLPVWPLITALGRSYALIIVRASLATACVASFGVFRRALAKQLSHLPLLSLLFTLVGLYFWHIPFVANAIFWPLI